MIPRYIPITRRGGSEVSDTLPNILQTMSDVWRPKDQNRLEGKDYEALYQSKGGRVKKEVIEGRKDYEALYQVRGPTKKKKKVIEYNSKKKNVYAS